MSVYLATPIKARRKWLDSSMVASYGPRLIPKKETKHIAQLVRARAAVHYISKSKKNWSNSHTKQILRALNNSDGTWGNLSVEPLRARLSQ